MLNIGYTTEPLPLSAEPFRAINRLQEFRAIWSHLEPFFGGAEFIIIIKTGVFSLHFLAL
jgi:hypothetical protein